MGILKKSIPTKSESSAVTIISPGIHFKGEIIASGRLHIDGSFEGTISSNTDVSIGKQGMVTGDIKAPNVNVSGRFEGDVSCNELHIEDGGDVRGTVISNKMSIDGTGMFVGERRTVETLIPTASTVQGFLGSDSESGQLEATDLDVDIFASLPDKITLAAEEE